MTLTPILTAPPMIQLHVAAALLAVLLGPFSLWRKRRDRWHRMAGMVWITAMLVTATTAWFINEIALIGPFSPIHIFSLMTYWSIFRAMRAVRAGRFRDHGRELRALYLQAIGLAGVFTLLPGRRMHAILFGDSPLFAAVVMVPVVIGLVVLIFRAPRLEIVR